MASCLPCTAHFMTLPCIAHFMTLPYIAHFMTLPCIAHFMTSSKGGGGRKASKELRNSA